MKQYKTWLAGLCLGMASLGAQAAILSVVAPATAAPGSSFDAQIFVNDVTDFAGFEFDLNYASPDLDAMIMVSEEVFGIGTTDEFINDITSVPGIATLVVFSTALSGVNITVPTLLATITFDVAAGAALGNSGLTFSNVVLSDGPGNPITTTLVDAQVNITNGSSGVPVPGTLWLMGMAMFGFGVQRRRARG